jgi:hypothetical protein
MYKAPLARERTRVKLTPESPTPAGRVDHPASSLSLMPASSEPPPFSGPSQYRIYLATTHPGTFELPQANIQAMPYPRLSNSDSNDDKITHLQRYVEEAGFKNIGDAFAVFMTAQFNSAQLQNDQIAAWRRSGPGATGGIQDVMIRLRAYDPLTVDAYKFKTIFHQEVLATAEPIYKREMTKFCVGKPSKEGWKSAPLYLKYENISGEVLTKNNFDAIQQEFSHRV